MKRFTELHEEIKTKRAVIAFGRFQPPTMGHSALIKHIHSFPGEKHIYISGSQDNKTNPLTSEERVGLLKKMHPEHANSFHSAKGDTSTIFGALSHAHKSGYTHVTVVGGPDRKAEYEKILKTYNGKKTKTGQVLFNFKSWKVASEEHRVGENTSNSGISGTKMRNAALAGDKATFRKGLHPNINDEEMHKLVNTIRTRLGHSALTEENLLREEYKAGKLFHSGDLVETKNGTETVVDLGTNYVSTVDKNGKFHRHWITGVKLVESHNVQPVSSAFYGNQVKFYGYKTSWFTKEIQEQFKLLIKPKVITEEIAARQLQLLMLVQSTDAMLGAASMENINYQKLRIEFDRSENYLKNFGVVEEHSYYRDSIENTLILNEIVNDVKLKFSDKMKAAHIIAKAVELPDIDKYKSAEDIVNAVAHHSRTKKFSVDGWKVIGKMMNIATRSGIKWNKDIYPKPTQKAIELE